MSTAFMIQDPRMTVAVTVSTAGVSEIVDQYGYRPASVDMSTAWTTAGMSFLGGNDTATMFPVYNSTAELTLSSALAIANISIAFTQDFSKSLGAHRFFQVRSGTSTAQSTQAAGRALSITFVPLQA